MTPFVYIQEIAKFIVETPPFIDHVSQVFLLKVFLPMFDTQSFSHPNTYWTKSFPQHERSQLIFFNFHASDLSRLFAADAVRSSFERAFSSPDLLACTFLLSHNAFDVSKELPYTTQGYLHQTKVKKPCSSD